MKLNGKITILFNEEGLKIEVMDTASRIEFLEIQLTQEQTCEALARIANTPCELEVRGLENVGKKREHKPFEFALPEDTIYHNKKEKATATANLLCPDGWVAATYFNSQDSFFDRGGKPWARTNIFRFIETGED